MSAKHTELMGRLGMAGAIVPTYRERIGQPAPGIDKALNRVEFHFTKAIAIYGRVGKQNLEKIGAKIDEMRERTCLGQARSIMTFIDYAVELLERALDGKKPIADIKGPVGRKAVKELIYSLCDLRVAITRGEFALCLAAGKRAVDVWEGVA